MSTQQRRDSLAAWARTGEIITQAGWSRRANISRPTAISDFEYLKKHGWQLEPYYQAGKVMGFYGREAVA